MPEYLGQSGRVGKWARGPAARSVGDFDPGLFGAADKGALKRGLVHTPAGQRRHGLVGEAGAHFPRLRAGDGAVRALCLGDALGNRLPLGPAAIVLRVRRVASADGEDRQGEEERSVSGHSA